MVVTANKKLMLLAVAVVINASLGFGLPWYYTISGLVQYGENIDRERLELLEDRQVIQITGDHSQFKDYFITGTYVIRNSGDAYQATLGILFDEWQGDRPSSAVTEIRFFVDDRQVDYIETNRTDGVVMGESERRLVQNATTWALIQVLFPESSIVTIQVQYKNRFTGTYAGSLRSCLLAYNPVVLSYFPELLYWKGLTKFSIEIINDFISENNVEHYWISDIVFEPIMRFHQNEYGDWINNVIYNDIITLRRKSLLRTCEYLTGLQELTTELMKIYKINGNTFRIDFTERFMNIYNRGIIINFNIWGGRSSAHAYVEPNIISKEIILGFIFNNANISQRRLAPYELVFLTNNQLRIMRNAFYARHGYVFNSKEIRNMFDIFDYSNERRFYEQNPDFHEGLLTEIDRANIETIRRLEALAGE